MRKLLFGILAAVVLTGCTAPAAIDTAQGITATATPTIVASTSATPAQAKAVADATLAASLTWQALGLYVGSGHADAAVVARIGQLAPPVHAALKAAQDAQRNGNSAAVAAGLSAFQTALGVLKDYATKNGVM